MKRVRPLSRTGFGVRFALLGLSVAVLNGAQPAPAAGAGWWDTAKAMAVDTQGNVYVTGSSATSYGSTDIATLKYDPDGKLLWLQRLSAPVNHSHVGSAITVDSQGNVYVAGSAYNPATASHDYVTLKYAADGTQVWIRFYDGPGKSSDGVKAITVDVQGSVYVTGSSYGGTTTRQDYATIKYGADGQRLWAKRYDGPAHKKDESVAIAVDDQRNVYVTGTSYDEWTYEDYATIKYSPEGQQLWVSRYSSEWNALRSHESARAMVLDGKGYLYVTGVSFSWPLPGARLGGNYDTVKYRCDSGQRAWMRRYDGPSHGDDYPAAIAVDTAGDVYVTGVSPGGSPGSGTAGDFATVKYSSGGIERWAKRYDGPDNSFDEAIALILDSQGDLYVTGSSCGTGTGLDFATVKYRTTDGYRWWVRRFGSTSVDNAVGVGLDSKGNVYVAGTSPGKNTSDDYVTVKYDKDGARLWVERYAGMETLGDLAAGLVVDTEGNVYVAGTSYRAGTAQDYTTVAYGAAGNQRWVRRYNGLTDGSDEVVGIGADGLGNIYVVGNSPGTGDIWRELTTVKYRGSDGLLRWTQRYHSDNLFDSAVAVAVNAKGDVGIAGVCYNSTTRLDGLTLKYDTDGQRLWARTYNGPASRYDYPFSLTIDQMGRVYVVGYTYMTTDNEDYFTIKYDDTRQVWLRTYDGTAKDWDGAEAVAVDSQGNVFVTGHSRGTGNVTDCVTLKYSPAGAKLWESRYSVTGQANYGKAITVDAQGNVYVTGESFAEASNYDYLTLKYSPAGQVLWDKRYNGPGNGEDVARSIAVDADGNVYVTGKSRGSSSFADYCTIKYTSGGVQSWVKRYNGPGNGWDNAVALALDNQGNLYVTGTSYGGMTTGDDYATIKYRTSDGQRLWVQRWTGVSP